MWRKRLSIDAEVLYVAACRWHSEPRVVAELGAWENAVYLIEARRSVQVLRLVDADRQSADAVAAEISFVDYLAGAGLPVARPIASTAGRLIEPIATQAGRRFLASSFEYLSGAALSAEQCRAAPEAFWRAWGRAVARLHCAAAEFTPAGPKRPRWDDDPLVRRYEAILAAAAPALTGQFAENLDWLRTLKADRHTFGLVHGDLHGRNFRYDGREFRIFDFDDSCYSWWAYDLAVGVAWAFGSQAVPPSRVAVDALLDGYNDLRTLTGDCEQQLLRFVRMRHFLDYMYGLDNLAQGVIEPQDRNSYREYLDEIAVILGDCRAWR